MKKTKGIALLLAAMFSLSCFAGCGEEIDSSDKDVNVKLWTELSTTKILRDIVYDSAVSSVMKYEMCKNEIEGAQLIITPQEGYEVGEFDVEVSELVGPDGAKISNDKIEIYLQKYINIYEKMTGNPNAQVGYHPDALLPFDKAVEYHENTVSGVNQGLYITVETEADTVAGQYTGTVKVTVDGVAFYAPMQVTVWDFEISDEVHVRSLFDVWPDQLMYYELDRSTDMVRAYNEALLKYRVTGNRLPYETDEEYVEEAIKATQDVRCTAFMLPYYGAWDEKVGSTLDFEKHMYYIDLLTQNSTEDCCLLDKAVFYPGALYDEPQMDASGEQNKRVIYISGKLQELYEEYYEELVASGYFNDKSEEYQQHYYESLTGIPNMVTGPYNAAYPEGGVTYCPLFDELHSQENRELYEELREQNGEVWWYGCVGPNYPYVTYHIDDNLVGSRILNYMMYDYNIDGNLYWCVNICRMLEQGNTGNITRPVNPYEEVRRDTATGAINGDGYLFYPGLDYGIYGPIGTLRLEMIRDGNEEYEYLYELDKMTQGLSEYYDSEISMEGMVGNLYKRLYSGAIYVTDEENYFQVRRELADIIERLNSDEKLVVSDIAFNGANASMEFYVADGYTVEVNGKAVQGTKAGQGMKYSVSMALDQVSNYFDIKLTQGESVKEYSIFVSGKMRVASDFDSESSAAILGTDDSTITVSHNTDEAFAIAGGSVKAHIVSKFDPDNPLATLTYYPELSITTDDLGVGFTKMDQLSVMVYNASGEDITVTIYLKANTGEYKMSEVKLINNQWNTITLQNVSATNWKLLASANKVVFRFSNTVNNNNEVAMPDQIIYFDNLLVGETT